MGKRGPAPKPTALRLLHGDQRKRINRYEPIPRDVPPQPPSELSVREQAVWDRIVPELSAMGIAFSCDADVIRAYCSAVVAHEQAAKLVFTAGVVIKGRLGEPVRNPAVMVLRQQADLIRLLGRELGLSPAARANLGSTDGEFEDAGARLLSS